MSHIYSPPPGKRTPQPTQGHTGPHGAARGMNDRGGGEGGRPCSIQRAQCPWFPWEDVMGLLVQFHSRELRGGQEWGLVLVTKQGVELEDLPHRSRVGIGDLPFGHLRSCTFRQKSWQSLTLGLNFSLRGTAFGETVARGEEEDGNERVDLVRSPGRVSTMPAASF